MTNIQLWQNRSFVLKDVRLRRGIPDNLTRKKMAVRWNLPQQKISGLLLLICWKLAEVVDDDRQLATGAAERPILSRIDAASSYWYVFDNRHFQSLSYRKSAQITRSGAPVMTVIVLRLLKLKICLPGGSIFRVRAIVVCHIRFFKLQIKSFHVKWKYRNWSIGIINNNV